MPASRPEYRLGRIISARLLGRNGKREEHPAIILSPDTEIVQPADFDPRGRGGAVHDNLVAVMGISSKYDRFDDPYIRLPVGLQTQLTRDCAAILNWLAVLSISDDCEFLLGDVPPRLMVQINREYRKLLEARLTQLRGSLADCISALRLRR